MTDRHPRWMAVGVGVSLALVLLGCKGKKVAEINGEPITVETFTNVLESRYGAETLRSLILQQLILQSAKQAGVQPTQAEIDEQLQNFKKQVGSEEDYFRYLKQNGLEEADLQRDILVSLSLFKLQTQGINPSEADLTTFFQQNKRFFDQPERIRFHQIILLTKEDADRVYGRLLEGITFEAIAKTDSVERLSGEQGGAVPLLPAAQVQQMQPDLYQLLKNTKPGTISKPTRIQFRNPQNPAQTGEVYAIVRVDELLPPKAVTYEEVKDTVRQAYLQQKAKPQEALLQELSSKANVLIYSERFRWLENTFGGRAVVGEGLPTVTPEGELKGGAPERPSITPPATRGGTTPGPVLPPTTGK